jgi:hypothetical protein
MFTGLVARHVALAGALLGLTQSASAQLVFGTTTSTTSNPAAIHLNVTTGQTTTLWNSASNKKVNGLAADQTGQKLYSNDAARLNVWDYGNIGTTPTLIAGMYRSNGTTTSATGFSGLAWANGKLYGSTSFASSTFTRGIYEIPLVPNASNQLITTQVWAEAVNTGVLQLDGIDFNPADGLFYGVQSADNTATGGTLTRGVYSIDVFGTGAFTKIAEFPGGNTRVDGLAVGGGKLWLTQQTGASAVVEIFPYDLTTQTYGSTISFALADASNRASGATWAPGVPEPTSVAFVAGAAALLRRRR